jgi:uncharacterized protein (TIGR00369 family)
MAHADVVRRSITETFSPAAMIETSPAMTYALKAFESLPHCRYLGMQLTALSTERVEMFVPYAENLIGNPKTGVVHGGVITTLLDTLGGLAVMAAAPEGRPVATLDLRIDYLKPATPGMNIRGVAECYKLTASVAFVRGHAFHEDTSDPIAHCTGTFMISGTGFPASDAEPASDG